MPVELLERLLACAMLASSNHRRRRAWPRLACYVIVGATSHTDPVATGSRTMRPNFAGYWNVNVVLAVTLPKVAVTVTCPAVLRVRSPCDPTVLLMVAMAVLSTDQVTPVVMSDCEPLLKLPVAVNC